MNIKNAAFLLATFGFILTGLLGCAKSYCGLPCDDDASKYASEEKSTNYAPVKQRKPKNRFRTIYGYMDVGDMSVEELWLEKLDLEMVLGRNNRDLDLLRSLSNKDNSIYRTDYSGMVNGKYYYGTATTTSGNSWADLGNNIEIAITRSKNERVFNRYREVVLRLEGIRIQKLKEQSQVNQANDKPQNGNAAPGVLEIKN